jgi:hypothetical protein
MYKEIRLLSNSVIQKMGILELVWFSSKHLCHAAENRRHFLCRYVDRPLRLRDKFRTFLLVQFRRLIIYPSEWP